LNKEVFVALLEWQMLTPSEDEDRPTVIAAEPQHAERVFGVLTLAFAADPPNRWMFPEPAQYLRHFRTFARALGGPALLLRTAIVSQDYSAVALWLGPGAGPDVEALMNLTEESVAPEKRAVLAVVIEEMTRHHPEEPHWYLPLIGVDPARQGKGLGAALLRPILAECDRKLLPAYLESTNPRNRPLYERHGFEAICEIRAGDFPPIVPMLRRPKPLDPSQINLRPCSRAPTK
jgi:GNAT superfamily N-acetyltransferase